MGKIAALLIGQRPRPDLTEPLRKLLPNWEIIELGALDGLTEEDLPDVSDAAYPLTTRLANGRIVQVTSQFVEPLLQQKLDEIEDEVAASILLCAGTFAGLRGKRPLIKPFDLAVSTVRALGFRRLGIIAPFPEQEEPIRQRWESVGVETAVWTADISKQDKAFHTALRIKLAELKPDVLILDYVGHDCERVERLKTVHNIPVIDLGEFSVTAMTALFL